MTRQKLCAIAGAAALIGLVSVPAQANLIINGGIPGTPDTFKTEPGQGIPTGVGGDVNGSLSTVGPEGNYTFSFLGGGNATFFNEFWVGSLANAVANGDIFCNQSGDPLCANNPNNDPFNITFAGNTDIPFAFGCNSMAATVPNDGPANPVDGCSYLANIGLGPKNDGPGPVAFLGLSDQPADNDFQDLTLSVTTPEPLTLSLFGAGLAGAVAMRRRRKTKKTA